MATIKTDSDALAFAAAEMIGKQTHYTECGDSFKAEVYYSVAMRLLKMIGKTSLKKADEATLKFLRNPDINPLILEAIEQC